MSTKCLRVFCDFTLFFHQVMKIMFIKIKIQNHQPWGEKPFCASLQPLALLSTFSAKSREKNQLGVIKL